MAFREVEVDPAEAAGEFFKFQAIGDRFAGVFLRTRKRTVNFSDGSKITTYYFRTKTGEVSLDPTVDLARRLEKAQLQPGHKVIATYVADIPSTVPGRQPMKQYKLLVDDEVKPAAPPPPPTAEFDDIPF